MSHLATRIATRKVLQQQLAIYWLCQAGFAFKTSAGQIVYVDPYLSDVVERLVGFKRMMPSPLAPEEVVADVVVCTHEHLDHLDTDALAVVGRDTRTHFAGPVECIKEFKKLGIADDRCHLLVAGRSVRFGSTEVHAVYADHGELAPDAVGVVLDFDGIKVYHTGDTAYRPEQFQHALNMRPDILLPCINGAFGNLNALEAAELTQLVAPRIVIPTHFWMFVEQNGEPGRFLEFCSAKAPGVKVVIMQPGSEFVFGVSPHESNTH